MFSTLKAIALINKVPKEEVDKFRLNMLSDRYAYYMLVDIAYFHLNTRGKKSILLRGYESYFTHRAIGITASITRKKDNVKMVGRLEDGKYLAYIEIDGKKVLNAREKYRWVRDLFDDRFVRIYLALNKVKRGFYQYEYN